MSDDASSSGEKTVNSTGTAMLLGVYLVFVAAVACWMLLLLFPVTCLPSAKDPSVCADARSAGVVPSPAPSVAPSSGAPATPASAASAASAASVASAAPSASVKAAPSAAPSASGAPVKPAPSAAVGDTPAVTDSVVPTPAPAPVAAAPLPLKLVFGHFHHMGFTIDLRGSDDGLLLLALLAGVLGSFMHAAQSLAMYVGNGQLKTSWLLWYMLRPAIGGVLGLLFYFFLRAGLIPSAGNSYTDAVSPYGVVAFGALAGWFSKRATDKLAEIFETLFRTAKDQEYRDPLSKDGKPEIHSVDPAKISLAAVPAAGIKLVFTCDKLAAQAWLNIDGVKQATTSEGGMKLSCVVPLASLKVAQPLKVTVSNPPSSGAAPGARPTVSDPFNVPVEV